MFSSFPFRSLLENVQDLWFWVKIEKVMKENVRMRQNKTSQNIRKKRYPFIPIWFPTARYGCHIEPFGHLMKSLRPHVFLYGPPTGLQWPPLAQYGHLWSSYDSLRVRYDPIWTQMSPFWLFMYTCRPYIGIFYWQSWWYSISRPFWRFPGPEIAPFWCFPAQ